jgi:pimeloyl-ACP methyl ester carboxylesterase
MVFQIGEGEYDKIGIHRVVKEIAPYQPLKAKNAVMLVHGDSSNFSTAFLPSTDKKPVQQSLAAYLAKNGTDVWGIDLRWTFIPSTVTDFTFLKDWNTALHLNDIKKAVKFARFSRAIDGSGEEKMYMLGHSRGAYYAFAYANEETQLTEQNRDLKGIIPIDLILKLGAENQDMKDAALVRYQLMKQAYDGGKY